MSDEAYNDFLNKANQDTGADKAAQKESPLKTRAVDTDIPAALKGIESYYTSEADEPWEPVSLTFEGDALKEGKDHQPRAPLLGRVLTMKRGIRRADRAQGRGFRDDGQGVRSEGTV